MKLRVYVEADGLHWRGAACMDVPDVMRRVFDTIKTCDDRRMAYITGDAVINDPAVKVKMAAREDAAKYLAEAITKHLLDAMGQDDTHNGYSKTHNVL
ncbi:MAG: hypothetical protein ACYC36_03625 [Bellilinea sp.]